MNPIHEALYVAGVVLVVLVFLVWASFISIYAQDKDTLDFSLRPWVKAVLRWLRRRHK